MKAAVARLVVLGLVGAFVVGQAGAWVRAHRSGLVVFGGCLADAVAVLIVAGIVGWVSYMRTGHFVPGHGRPPREVAEPFRPGPLECDGEIVQLGDGVWAGPSVELAEGDGEDGFLPVYELHLVSAGSGLPDVPRGELESGTE